MKKQGGRGSKFAEHGCEIKQRKIVVGRFTDLSTKYKFKMARMYSKLAPQHVWSVILFWGSLRCPGMKKTGRGAAVHGKSTNG